ncbi:putative lipoprotein YiaD [Ensifer psoraleae]|uniref:OmpA family protein n=1 Tax=Sinorhizobium psoraleae TaxID=520838 RepID=UPI00156A5DF8|nr:OmpA family protein [Sinorhizobium psoraleae]NRP74093.1 putative lipoprotein YiaD [Sinorhizobium psoraleae]
MSIRSRLFATVALPVFAASFAVQPALAESLMAPFEIAQEGAEEPSPEELLLKKRRKQRAAEEEPQGQAEEQQRQAEEEAPVRKKRRQQAEEQQPAAEEAPRQAEEQQAPRRKKRQQQAEEQQPAAEERAPEQAEEQQAPRRKKRQQQAEEQQPAAEEGAPQQAEEQQTPRRKKRQQQAEEQQPAAEEAPQQAEEQQAPARKKRQQQAEEQQPAAEEGAPQQAEEQQAPARKKRQQQQAEEGQPAAEEGAPQQAEEQQAPARRKRQQQAEEQRQTDQPAEQIGEGEQPAPGAEAPATAEGTGERPRGQRAPEVVDERTEEEKVKIAKDPAASDDTVVLPVENGAAVLDSDKDADNVGGNRAREARRKQREELRAKEESVAPPTDDAAAQAKISTEVREQIPQRIEANLNEEGQRIEEAPVFAVPETTNIVNNTVINNTTNNVTEVEVVEEVDDRVILGVGDRIFVRGDDRPRLRRDSEETFYDQLPRDRVRETIVRPGGYRIVTVYNRYGDIVQRSRIDRDGNEYLLIYAPEYEEDQDRPAIVDVGYELPPMRLTIPVEDYIVDYADDPDRDYYEFLSEPPVEQVERVYTIDEVRNSARLRDKVRRIDLDTIHFETGSAEVSMSQAKTLRGVADGMSKILEKDPGETFFIEGHTDAVGSDRSNLVLSDQRAESVAVLLSEVYGVPAENLVTQGYGERFLKVRTQDEEQENRRVTIRRVTPLVRPVAQR